MSPRKRDEVKSALERKGFQLSNTDHLKLVYHNKARKKTGIWTKISHGSDHKDISDDNLSRMAKQCRLHKKDFNRLLDCPLSRDEYEAKLVANGDITG